MSEDIIFPIAHPYTANCINWMHGQEKALLVQEQQILMVAEEVPLALVYNGIDYAVMMVTPHDVNDFIVGFLLLKILFLLV